MHMYRHIYMFIYMLSYMFMYLHAHLSIILGFLSALNLCFLLAPLHTFPDRKGEGSYRWAVC